MAKTHFSKSYKKLFIMNKLKRILSIFCATIFIDWFISTKFIHYDGVEDVFKEVDPKKYGRMTINKLLANISSSQKIVENPKAYDVDEGKEGVEFLYQEIICKKNLLVIGGRNKFRICYSKKIDQPPRLVTNKFSPKAYFINGPRDNEFEKAFKMMTNETLLKVFTRHNTSIKYSFKPDLVEDIDVRIYVDEDVDVDGRRIMGIKDLIDSHDDYHQIEFIKFEMKKKIDPIIFSINIPVFASHLLLRLEYFTYKEFCYLIKRLAENLYYPYSIISHSTEGIHFLSLMHKYSIEKYDIKEMKKATLKKSTYVKKFAEEL